MLTIEIERETGGRWLAENRLLLACLPMALPAPKHEPKLLR